MTMIKTIKTEKTVEEVTKLRDGRCYFVKVSEKPTDYNVMFHSFFGPMFQSKEGNYKYPVATISNDLNKNDSCDIVLGNVKIKLRQDELYNLISFLQEVENEIIAIISSNKKKKKKCGCSTTDSAKGF